MNQRPEFKNGSWMQFKNLLAVKSGVLLLCVAAAHAMAQTYTVLHRFGPSYVAAIPYPSGPLVQGPDGTLYGSQPGCAGAYYGQLFKVNPDGSDFRVLKSFTGGIDGDGPRAGLVLSGTNLYGTTLWGGIHLFYGTLFKINTNASGFTLLKSFDQGLEEGPQPGLVLSGTTLYGTSVGYSDTTDPGIVYKINTDGSGYAVLKWFSGPDGSRPWGGLVLSGTILFGTTLHGGASNRGTVFRINTDGSGFAVLKSFTGPDGDGPWCGVALSGTTLFGTTSSGGGGGAGTVFSINTDGSGFTMLTDFTGTDGSYPRTRPVLSGTSLYGTTDNGGEGYGTVFRMNKDGSGYATLRRFTSTDGGPPVFGLLLSGTTLYGLTDADASLAGGVVFSLSMAPPSAPMVWPTSQRAEAGSTAAFFASASGDPVFVYRWFFNGTNALGGATTDYAL
jgi:uncharacterized repeat protein (TIGR03803 family)